MELIERYLKTVKSGLPADQKEDIVRELSENIYSEIEERENQEGRKLEESEVAAMLRRHGNPLLVASRYRQDTRSLAIGKQLIGPTLFPFYARVLSFNLGLTAIIILVIFTALLAGGKAVGVRSGLSVLFWNLAIQLLVITAIFTVVDRYAAKHPDTWNCGKGTPVQLREMEKGEPRISRSSSFSQVLGLCISVVWLRAIQRHPFFIFGPAAVFLKLAPVWHQVYPAIVFIYMVLVVQAMANFVRPDWVRLPQLARAVTSAMWLVMYFYLFKAGVWVTATSEAGEGYQHGIAIANQVIFYCLIGAVIITIAMLAIAVRRFAAATPQTGGQNEAVRT